MMPQDKINKIFEGGNDWMGSGEGQLAIDVFETPQTLIIKAPMAGVKLEDLEIGVTDGTLVIRGARKEERSEKEGNYLVQECYWGAFSRNLKLPPGVDLDATNASLKNGILTITIPKTTKSKTHTIKVNTE